MSNRRDFFFKQLVAEDELDAAFADLESADRDIVKDIGLSSNDASPATQGGIVDGLGVTINSGLDVFVAAGAAFDKDGKRVALDAQVTLSVSNVGSTTEGQGGTADGATTDPGSGNSRWVSVFLVFDRLLSDGRIDGNSQAVLFERAESFHFDLTNGTPQLTASLGTPDADGAPRQTDKILIADVKVTNNGSTVFADSVDTSRREAWYKFSGVAISTVQTSIRDVLDDLYTTLDNLLSGGTGTPASFIAYAGGGNWADGTTNPATTVEDQLDKIIDDLAAKTAPSGAKKIGTESQSGAGLGTPSSASPLTLSSDTVEGQIIELLDAVNGRVFRGGDTTIGGDLVPSAAGRKLGDTSFGWNMYANEFRIDDFVYTSFSPINSSRDLGAAANYWGNIYVDVTRTDYFAPRTGGSIESTGSIVPSVSTEELGSSGSRWQRLYINRDVNIQPTAVVTSNIGLILDGSQLSNVDDARPIMGEIRSANNVQAVAFEPSGRIARGHHFVDDFFYKASSGWNGTVDDRPSNYSVTISGGGDILPAQSSDNSLMRAGGSLKFAPTGGSAASAKLQFAHQNVVTGLQENENGSLIDLNWHLFFRIGYDSAFTDLSVTRIRVGFQEGVSNTNYFLLDQSGTEGNTTTHWQWWDSTAVSYTTLTGSAPTSQQWQNMHLYIPRAGTNNAEVWISGMSAPVTGLNVHKGTLTIEIEVLDDHVTDGTPRVYLDRVEVWTDRAIRL